MKVVIDCNILISAGLNPGNCRSVIHTVIHSHECILSTDILHEYDAVSKRDRFLAVRGNLVQIIYSLSWNAHFVTPEPSIFRLPDVKDQVYLDTALTGMADVIVTGNSKHFPEGKYQDVQILSPKEFLDLLDVYKG